MKEVLKLNNFTVSNKLPPNWKSHFKFVVIRDPISRFCSSYLVFKRLVGKQKVKGVKDVNSFIDNIDIFLKDRHIAPQVEFLPCKMDLYLRKENINEDFKKLKEIKNYLDKVGMFNKVDKAEKERIMKEIKPKQLQKLKEIYKKDYEIYNQKSK